MIRRKKSWNWPAIFIAFILISSTFAVTFYGLTQGTQKKKYNGYTFTQVRDGWHTKINGRLVFFNTLPTDVEHIPLDTQRITAFRSTPEIDVTSSVNDANAGSIAVANIQMEQVLADLSQVYVRRGFLENTSYNLPIITCNESLKVPTVYFKTGDNTTMYVDGTCLVAQAQTGADVLVLRDRILYGIYGIIP